MKFKNTLTNNIFDVSPEEGKKLLEDYDCFELIEADAEEKKLLAKKEKKALTVQDKVLNPIKKQKSKN